MSVNIRESEAASRKRNHEEFTEETVRLSEDSARPASEKLPQNAAMSATPVNGSGQGHQTSPTTSTKMPSNTPPGTSSPAALTEAGSSTLGQNSPSPTRKPSKLPPQTSAPSNQPSAPTPSTQPTTTTATMPSTTTTQTAAPAKRKRRTPAEVATEEQARAEKRRKREEEAAAKALEKARLDAEKEVTRAAAAAAKAEKDAILAERKEQKARADAEKAAKKEKELKAQPNLFQFLGKKKAKQSNADSYAPVQQPDGDTATVKKEADSSGTAYDRMFKPFYVKEGVTVADRFFHMDEETKDAKSAIFDQYVKGERDAAELKPLDFLRTFQVFGVPAQRGILHPPVKKIMAEIYGEPNDKALGAASDRTESQNARFTSVKDQLDAIPVKVLSFYEDVRPPYVGTVTSNMTHDLQKLSRKPTGRILKLNYDYDSEAEWEEEDGEDLEDCEEDEEDNEGDEEMADFLDDAEDVAAVRPGFLRENSPTSTGICFEDRTRLGPSAEVYKYRMEFLLESLEHHDMIDPFSTEYWQPKGASQKSTISPSAPTSKPAGDMGPPPAPVDALGKLNGKALVSGFTATEKDLIPQKIFDDFKLAVISDDINFLTKGGMVDMLSKRFTIATRKQVQNTLEKIAERRSPAPKAKKQWMLLPEFAV